MPSAYRHRWRVLGELRTVHQAAARFPQQNRLDVPLQHILVPPHLQGTLGACRSSTSCFSQTSMCATVASRTTTSEIKEEDEYSMSVNMVRESSKLEFFRKNNFMV